MGSLTRRPYLLVGFFHMIIGLLLLSCGLSWLLMTFFYFPDKIKKSENIDHWNVWADMAVEDQVWAWIVYTVQIWSGFWIMMSGAFAMCVKDYGCLERLFLLMNTLSMLIFAPAAIVLSLELFFNTTFAGEGASLNSYSFIYRHNQDAAELFSVLELNNVSYPWILTFPIAGLSLGFIELVLSMVSCSVCLCCRPTRSYSY